MRLHEVFLQDSLKIQTEPHRGFTNLSETESHGMCEHELWCRLAIQIGLKRSFRQPRWGLFAQRCGAAPALAGTVLMLQVCARESGEGGGPEKAFESRSRCGHDDASQG